MSEPTPTAESTAVSPWKTWDWRLLGFVTRWLPNQPKPPPIAPVRFGLVLGMLESAIVGSLYGVGIICSAVSPFRGILYGIICLIASLFWGIVVGLFCGMIGGKILQYVKSLMVSLLVSFTIGAIGAGLIAFYVPMFAWFITCGPFWECAGVLCLTALILIPVIVLLPPLMYREIRAALVGMIVGSIAGVVGLTAVLVITTAEHFDVWRDLPLCVLIGLFGGLFDGGLAGFIVGAVVGALVNANRRTVLPIYVGFAGAIGLGLAGWFLGGIIADEAGKAIGSMLGISWGAMAGVKLGALLTPRAWRALLIEEVDPSGFPVFDMSDGRRLADFADTPAKGLLVFQLLAQISFRKRILCLEPTGEEYRVTFDSSGLDLELPPTLLLSTGRELVIALKELARLGPRVRGDLLCREGDLQVIVSKHRVNLHLVFEQTPHGERVTLTAPEDVGASDAMAAVGRRLTFVMSARRWVSPYGRPRIRFLWGTT